MIVSTKAVTILPSLDRAEELRRCFDRLGDFDDDAWKIAIRVSNQVRQHDAASSNWMKHLSTLLIASCRFNRLS